MGNICEVYENGQFVTEYKYDTLGRLVRENNKQFGKTFVFSYDNKGNILTRTEYAFTLKDDDFVKEATGTVFEYVYSGEKLVSYDHETFVYDAIGNPATYRYNTLTWSFGRRLTSFGNNTFDYNAEGKRIKKNDISYTYDSQGRLFAQSNGIEYFYDENSKPIAFKYNGEIHYYKKDLLGNVIEILDTAGGTVVKYTYGAWGNHKVLNPDGTENTSAMFIGNINPIRYHSYCFDTETGLYFLQTRYYDPQIGRFINIDDISYLEPESINGLNLYAYCGNNPVMHVDPKGSAWYEFWKWDWASIGKIVAGVAIVAGLVVGSIFTGGMLSVVLAGAAIGAGAGFLGGGISGLASGGGLAGFANGALAGSITGAISGAFAASPLGVGWQIGINAIIGAGNYSLNQMFSGSRLTLGGLIAGALTGAIMGLVGGAGWFHGSVGQLLKTDIMLNLSKNFISNSLGYLGKEFLTKFIVATVTTNAAGGVYGYLENTFLNKEGKFFGF